MAEKTLLGTIWDFISDIGNLQTLWQLAVSFGITTLGVSMMPSGWHQPQYWASAGLVFFGAWAVAATFTVGARKALPRIRRWLHPSVVVVTSDGGEKASITIKHHGGTKTVFSADGQIVRSLNDRNPNPAPSLFQCWLSKGNKYATAIMLGDGEWAQIVIGEIQGDVTKGTACLAIRRGHYASSEQPVTDPMFTTADDGVLVDIHVKAEPPLKRTMAHVYQFRVTPKRVNRATMHVAIAEESRR